MPDEAPDQETEAESETEREQGGHQQPRRHVVAEAHGHAHGHQRDTEADDHRSPPSGEVALASAERAHDHHAEGERREGGTDRRRTPTSSVEHDRHRQQQRVLGERRQRLRRERSVERAVEDPWPGDGSIEARRRCRTATPSTLGRRGARGLGGRRRRVAPQHVQHGQHDRQVHPEDRPPPERRRRQAADHRAEAGTDPDDRTLQAERPTPFRRRHRVAQHRLHARRQRRSAGGLQGPQSDQDPERRGDHGTERADAETADRDGGQPAGAQRVAHSTSEGLPHEHRDEVERDEHARMALGDVEVPGDVGQRHGDHRRVQRHERRRERDPCDGDRRDRVLGRRRVGHRAILLDDRAGRRLIRGS